MTFLVTDSSGAVVGSSNGEYITDENGRIEVYKRQKEECEAVAASGYPYGFGSNLTVFTGAAIADIAQRAVDNWEKSPGHFQAMTDPGATSLGVGGTKDNGVTYCYLFLGKPKTNNPYG